MPLWQRLVIVGVVMFATIVVARLIDRRIARRELPPEAITRYRVLRRSVTTTIIFVGLLSALLVIPQVRAVAGGLLASSAVVGIVVGFASQRTLGNFVAGLLIAFTQPLRLGDAVVVEDTEGIVEEIGLIDTFVPTAHGDRREGAVRHLIRYCSNASESGGATGSGIGANASGGSASAFSSARSWCSSCRASPVRPCSCRAAISTRSSRSRSVRTRSSTQRTARCSAPSRPRETASRS